MASFDKEEFVQSCIEATDEGTSAALAVRDLLERTVSAPLGIEDAVGSLDQIPAFSTWHCSDAVTVLHVVWPPEVDLYAHDHRMWAVIGLYGGREDNKFFRRVEHDHIESSGGKTITAGEVAMLGSDVVHAVANPTREWTGSIHIYGGDYFSTLRTQWIGEPLTAVPFDVDRLKAVLSDAGDRARKRGTEGE